MWFVFWKKDVFPFNLYLYLKTSVFSIYITFRCKDNIITVLFPLVLSLPCKIKPLLVIMV